jgi:hypothetical protein
MDLTEILCQNNDYIPLVQDRVPVAGSCEHGNELPGFKKGGEFLDKLRDY